MLRRGTWLGGLLLGLGLVFIGQRAEAVIEKPLPLKDMLRVTHVFVAKIEKLNDNAERPTMVLAVTENLGKTEPPAKQLRVVIEGTADAKKKKEPTELLKRLAPDLSLMVFMNRKPNKKYDALVFTNGTWFRMEVGDPVKDPWEFYYVEPYLRRAYAGTTDDLRQISKDAFAGKKDPPGWNKDETPGLGPELKKETPKPQGRLGISSGPVFGVIPTVAIGGPLAILAMLFPTLFGSPREIMRRWSALLTVASITSLIYLLHAWKFADIRQYWWGSQFVLWMFMAATSLAGAVWAWQRHRAAVRGGYVEDLLPRRGEAIIFRWLSLAGVVVTAYLIGDGSLLSSGSKELLLMWAVVWSATASIAWLVFAARRWPGYKPRLSLEAVMLAALGLACAALALPVLPRSAAATPIARAEPQEAKEDQPPSAANLVWMFKAEDPGGIESSPLVIGDKTYIAAAHRSAITQYGRLYCLHSRTGSKLWEFDDEGNMKQVFCSPCVADGRLYIGEGYHQDANCKMFCLNAETGKKEWEFATKSHTESSPAVVDGKLYFGAGDDGVYCLDAKTGKEIWHFEGRHVDTNPAIVNGRLYGGSGYGKTYSMFCLDAKNGNRLWETESRLPVFGSPTVVGRQVFFGTGNGDMINSSKEPAGGLVCANADNGKVLWRFDDVTDAVLTKPAADRRSVFVGSRDGHVYCVNRLDGKLRWKHNMGSPVVSSPALVTCSSGGDSDTLVALSTAGRVCCFNPEKDEVYWTFDVAKQSGLKPQLISSARIVVTRQGKEERRRIYFGAGLDNLESWTGALYCIEDRYLWPVAAGDWGDGGGSEGCCNK